MRTLSAAWKLLTSGGFTADAHELTKPRPNAKEIASILRIAQVSFSGMFLPKRMNEKTVDTICVEMNAATRNMADFAPIHDKHRANVIPMG
jgi:hypothetical protein